MFGALHVNTQYTLMHKPQNNVNSFNNWVIKFSGKRILSYLFGLSEYGHNLWLVLFCCKIGKGWFRKIKQCLTIFNPIKMGSYIFPSICFRKFHPYQMYARKKKPIIFTFFYITFCFYQFHFLPSFSINPTIPRQKAVPGPCTTSYISISNTEN